MANGGVIRKQRALMSGIYGRKAGQYRMWPSRGIAGRLKVFRVRSGLRPIS